MEKRKTSNVLCPELINFQCENNYENSFQSVLKVSCFTSTASIYKPRKIILFLSPNKIHSYQACLLNFLHPYELPNNLMIKKFKFFKHLCLLCLGQWSSSYIEMHTIDRFFVVVYLFIFVSLRYTEIININIFFTHNTRTYTHLHTHRPHCHRGLL